LFRLLEASPLPYAERLDLEAELIELLKPSSLMGPRPIVVVVHEDACGEHDTSVRTRPLPVHIANKTPFPPLRGIASARCIP